MSPIGGARLTARERRERRGEQSNGLGRWAGKGGGEAAGSDLRERKKGEGGDGPGQEEKERGREREGLKCI
jgi:hypothetical protein